MKLSIVIPCFNEQEVIRKTNGRLLGLLEGFYANGVIRRHEIIYVDDGSRDATLSILKELAEKDSNIKVISFTRNFGHQCALSAGLHHATGDVTVSMDADLQDPPEAIEEMIRQYQSGYDIVYGVRRNRDKDTLFKRNTARLFYRFMRKMGVDLVENHADFRLLSKPVLEAFRDYTEVNRFLRGMFPLMGFRRSIVEYERVERFAGETKYPLKRMVSFAIEGITSFSYLPLRVASILGLAISLVAFFLIVWVIAVKFLGLAVPGWASTVLPIYLLGGIQLVVLGIIGEYIGKIYVEVKRRPLYLIKETVNFRTSCVNEDAVKG
jgi:glycosyltransferase involved in cell wall biosynthesis